MDTSVLTEPAAPLRVCITGAAGYVGTLLAAQLAARPGVTVSGVDLRPRQGGAVPVRAMDIRDPALAVLLRDRASGQPLYEAHATGTGNMELSAPMMAAMFEAALADFPKANPQGRDVAVQMAP